MKKLFSPTTGGFYSEAIHKKKDIPGDAVEVTPEQEREIRLGQTQSKVVRMDRDKALVLEDRPPEPPVRLAARARRRRDALLRDSDWTQLPDTPLTDDQRQSWSAYRASLRDVPQQDGFPTTITWPDAPGTST